jgi:hypothetical protein
MSAFIRDTESPGYVPSNQYMYLVFVQVLEWALVESKEPQLMR